MKRLEKLLAISFDEKDKKVLKRVREVRNCLEHFDFKANSKALENDIYKAVKILLQFITGNLLEFCSGDNENALLSQIKTEVARLDLHYQSLLKLAHEHMEKNGITKEDVVTCPECLEETFSIEESDKNYHVCYFCGWNGNTNSDNIRIANAFIEKRMGSSYSVIKDGGEWPQYFCPECGEYTWVVMKDFSKCLNCCEDFYGRTKICDSCGSPFATSDDESDICESCWEYKFSKD